MAVIPTSAATGQMLRTVTPSPTSDLPDGPCRALHVNDAGTVTVALVARDDTSSVSWTLTGPGDIPIAVRAVRVSGTTAASIVAIY